MVAVVTYQLVFSKRTPVVSGAPLNTGQADAAVTSWAALSAPATFISLKAGVRDGNTRFSYEVLEQGIKSKRTLL